MNPGLVYSCSNVNLMWPPCYKTSHTRQYLLFDIHSEYDDCKEEPCQSGGLARYGLSCKHTLLLSNVPETVPTKSWGFS